MTSETVKARKDAFVSALANFRKVGNELSDAAIGLVAALESAQVLDPQDKLEIFKFTTAFSGTGKTALEPPKATPIPASITSEADAEEVQKPTKKRKRVVDPNQPKRPLPLVLEYLNAEKKRIREERANSDKPSLDISEITAMAREAWANVPDDEKTKLLKRHDERVAKYQEELNEYKRKKQEEGGDVEQTPVKAAPKKDAKITKTEENAQEPPSSPTKQEVSKKEEETPKKRSKKDASSPEKKDKKRKKKSKEPKEPKESKE